MNFVSWYSSLPSFDSTTIRSASTSTTVPALSEMTTSPVSTAARYSSPVPISGGSVIISGTACRCMFAPISARFASLCSRNGISAVATDTICAGATSMYSMSLGSAVTASPSRERHSTCSWRNRPVFGSMGSDAWAIVYCASSAASRYTMSSLTLPPTTRRYGVWMKPNWETVANDASEPIKPMFGPSGVSIGHMRP